MKHKYEYESQHLVLVQSQYYETYLDTDGNQAFKLNKLYQDVVKSKYSTEIEFINDLKYNKQSNFIDCLDLAIKSGITIEGFLKVFEEDIISNRINFMNYLDLPKYDDMMYNEKLEKLKKKHCKRIAMDTFNENYSRVLDYMYETSSDCAADMIDDEVCCLDGEEYGDIDEYKLKNDLAIIIFSEYKKIEEYVNIQLEEIKFDNYDS